MRRALALAAALVFGFVAVMRAGPLEIKQVGADAKWAAHLDIDALHASTAFQKAKQEALKKHPEAEVLMAGIREVWKFDPCTDLHAITMYCSQFKKDTGVAIVHAKVNQDLLLEKAKAAPGHSATAHGKYELHTWIHAKGSKHERSMTGTFYKPDVMVFGASADEVAAALDVLDGTKSNISESYATLGESLPAGAILVAGATGLADANLPGKCPVAKQVEWLLMATGESQGEMFFQGKLTMNQPEVAQQIKTVIDGALAAASLMHGDDAEAAKLVGAAKVAVADKTIAVDWKAPVDAVLAHVQKEMAKRAAHKDGSRHGPLHDKHSEK